MHHRHEIGYAGFQFIELASQRVHVYAISFSTYKVMSHLTIRCRLVTNLRYRSLLFYTTFEGLQLKHF